MSDNNKICIMKLLTGEDVICYVDNEDDEYVYVRMPFTLVPSENGVMVIPFSVATIKAKKDDVYAIRKGATVMITPKVPAELESMYIEKTTGLITKSNGIILG